MENKKIDITSTALEKGIDTAKTFLDKLIMPAIEEAGLLLREQVTMWKFKNQIRMLNKAKAYCEKNRISPKTISLKLLCPLLDYSALEEDDVLHDKWAILLSNMVDSEQNIENHVFPYILSQLSSNEFLIIEKAFDVKQKRVAKLKIELKEFMDEKPQIEKELDEQLEAIKGQISQIKQGANFHYDKRLWDFDVQRMSVENQIRIIGNKELSFNSKIEAPQVLPDGIFKEFELSNVIRLGLVKEEKEFYAISQPLEIPNDHPDEYRPNTRVNLEIDMESTVDYILTELGELFVNACKEKREIGN